MNIFMRNNEFETERRRQGGRSRGRERASFNIGMCALSCTVHDVYHMLFLASGRCLERSLLKLCEHVIQECFDDVEMCATRVMRFIIHL